MMDIMENIKKLSAALDAETASLHPSDKLLLLGSQDITATETGICRIERGDSYEHCVEKPP